jgi:hypothetical protein
VSFARAVCLAVRSAMPYAWLPGVVKCRAVSPLLYTQPNLGNDESRMTSDLTPENSEALCSPGVWLSVRAMHNRRGYIAQVAVAALYGIHGVTEESETV